MTEIMGMKVYPSVQDLPEAVDLAIVILPAVANPQAVRECAAKGIQAIVLAAAGFSEVADEGEHLQKELIQVIQETGVRVLGPNTSGHISTPANFTSSFFPLGKIRKGKISYIAQTGNFATHTMRYITTGEHFGVARVIGLGNKVDIEESEVLAYLAHDRATAAILIYLESIKRPREFFQIARQVTQQKPVFLLKGGSTAEGAKAAVAHTAAIAAEDRIIDGLLRQAGIMRIHEYSHLFLVAKVLASMPIPRSNRISFLAPSGAMLVSLTDYCLSLGLNVPDFSESTRKYLQDMSPSIIRMRNPVDIWFAAGLHGAEFAYHEGMRAALKDPNIDAVVSVLMLTDDTGIPNLQFIVDLAAEFPDKPIYVTLSGEKKHMDAGKAFLEPRGIPTFPLIEQPFKILSILNKCRKLMERS
jgi:acetyltransferase